MKIKLSEIEIGPRIRGAVGPVDDLIEAIERAGGIIQPIILDQNNKLLNGRRRLEAATKLGYEEIEYITRHVEDDDERLMLEWQENEGRKDLSPSKRLELAKKFNIELKEKAKKRKEKAQFKKEKPKKPVTSVDTVPDRGPEPEPDDPNKGRDTRDIVAEKAGFKSGKQYERAKEIFEKGDDELKAKVDAGEVSITAAHKIIKEGEGKAPPKPTPKSVMKTYMDAATTLQNLDLDIIKALSEKDRSTLQTTLATTATNIILKNATIDKMKENP